MTLVVEGLSVLFEFKDPVPNDGRLLLLLLLLLLVLLLVKPPFKLENMGSMFAFRVN